MIFLTIATRHGLGRHFESLNPAQQQASLRWIIRFVEIFAIVTCMFGRLSFSVFLLYIIAPMDKTKRVALWSVIAVQVLINLITVVQIYAQRGHRLTALWDYAVAATATCQSPQVETVIGYGMSSGPAIGTPDQYR